MYSDWLTGLQANAELGMRCLCSQCISPVVGSDRNVLDCLASVDNVASSLALHVFHIRPRSAGDNMCPTCCCVTSSTVVEHPSGCGHTTCVACIRKMQEPADAADADDPQPESFGMQVCDDEDFINVFTTWTIRHPDQYKRYNDARHAMDLTYFEAVARRSEYTQSCATCCMSM
jgi:hypothetical protein